MKTLELNQLKNYLGTGLVIQREGLNPLTTDLDLELDLSAVEMMIHGGYKPHFYPLSMLTEEITVDGETFVPIEKIKEIDSAFCFVEVIRDFDDLFFSYQQAAFSDVFWVVQKLFEWHFWIFDQEDFGTFLIDKSKIN